MIEVGVTAALFSAATQAAAHALLKAGRDKLIVRGLIALTTSLVVAPAALFVPLPSGNLWPWLILCGLLHTIYQFVLVAAYGAADFSVAYPLARGVVPVFTALIGIACLADRLTIIAMIGIVIVSGGIILIAARSAIHSTGLIWAALAGLLTTTYTVIDGKAIRLASEASTFIVWFFVMDGLMMVPLVLWFRRRHILPRLVDEGWRGLLAGLSSLVTYGSALLALRLLPVGAASALRETSIVFGALIARFALRELVTARRAVGISLVSAGAALVALGLV